MAPEPNRPIEDALKAYAKKRAAEGGSFELHPADRRKLLAEAARLAPGQERGRSDLKWWQAFWPRIGFAVSLVAIMAGVIWLQFPKSSQVFSLAKQDRPAQGSVLREESGPADPPEEIPQRAKKETADTSAPKDRPPATPAPSAPAALESLAMSREAVPPAAVPSPAPQPAPEKGVSTESRRDNLKMASRPEVEATAPASPPAPSLPAAPPSRVAGLAGAETKTQSAATPSYEVLQDQADTTRYAIANSMPGGSQRVESRSAQEAQVAVRQRFQALPSEPEARPRPTARPSQVILRNFDVEQEGDRIRITDEDGSVYTGQLVAATSDGGAAQAPLSLGVGMQPMRARGVLNPTGQPQQQAQAAAQAGQQIQTGYAFQARGTNRSLQQAVVIEAALIPPLITNQNQVVVTAPPPTQAPVMRGGRAGDKGATQMMSQTQRQQAPGITPPTQKIQGRVTIGGTNELWLEALPATP